MGNKTLIRHDGSTVTVPEADADKLLTLGYREQTPTQEMEAGIAQGIENYYTTPGQQVKTALEGGLSGLSLGLTDLAFGSEESSERARYNPGLRLGSELVGGLLPLAPGLGALTKFTPMGALTRGAEMASEAIGGGKVAQAATRSAIEGAGIGGGSALTQAQLNGDPITAEAVGAGMGWGALFAGGLGAIGGGLQSRYEGKAAARLAEEESRFANIGAEERTVAERAEAQAKVHSVVMEGMKERTATVRAMEEAHYSRFSGAIQDAAATLKQGVKAAEEVTKDLNFTSLGMSQRKIYSQLADNLNLSYVRSEARAFEKSFAEAKLAAEQGNYEKMINRLEKFQDNMATIETKLGGPKMFSSEKVVGQAQDLIGLAKQRLDSSVAAAEELTAHTATQATLAGFPKTAKEFVGMTPERVEKLSAAIDNLGKLKSAELDSIKAAVSDAVGNLESNLGMKMEGSPGQRMQGIWRAMKEGARADAKLVKNLGKEGNLLWGKANEAADKYSLAKMGGDTERHAFAKKGFGSRSFETFMRYNVGKSFAQKMGTPGYLLGSGLVSGLVSLKGAILGTIAEQAEKWLPRAGKAMQKYGSRVEPLMTRLDGQEDEKKRSRKELMEARSKEIAEAAPGVRDTLYKSIGSVAAEHPEFAAQLHGQSVARFQFLLSKLPKDPGLAFSNLKSMWKPDDVATEKFARYYEVFHDPVGVMVRSLKTGQITMEAAEGLKEMNPELWQTLRVNLLDRLSDPKVTKHMTYSDQVHMGMLLGIPLHSSMNPQFISSQQQMYTERNQPLEMNPRIQPGGGAGRPSGPGPAATSAQRTTEH